MSKLSYVIKLTGYIFDIYNDEAIKELYDISRYIKRVFEDGYRFILVVGGGRDLRTWIRYLKRFSSVSEYDLDLLGISFTRLNAEILCKLLHPTCLNKIPKTVEEAILSAVNSNKNLVMGGVSPGFSTNAVAAYIASSLSIPFINMTRAGGVYNKDPSVYRDAKILDHVKVDDLLKLMSSYAESAGHYPLLDKTSLRIIKEFNVKTFVIPASRDALEKILHGEKIGTVIDTS